GLALFHDSDERRLSTLASMLSSVDEPSGAVLARQGEVAHSFLVVTAGEAAVLRDDGDGERQVATVGPGAIVGELSVLRAAPRSASVTATRPLTGYAGDARAFAALLDVPGVAERIARTARQRLAANSRPVEVTLRDGARLRIRPILPTDRGKLADTQPGFSRESHYKRFFSAPPLSDKVVQYLVDVDYFDHFAWVALPAQDDDGPGVASARYIRERTAPDTAEVAFSVVDDYQGRGLGTLLVGALAVAAAQNGVRRFRARVLAENEPMRAILRRAGAQLDFAEPGVLETVVDVPAFGDGLPDLATANALRATARDIVVAADLALGAAT
ncbi:MAG TPA: GNAT family N-acetyltransferase, partial [Acidimicrobiia bacterium]|nr:GNAT family N-acetyltransferase [Acidimicrobiia bacterium]